MMQTITSVGDIPNSGLYKCQSIIALY